MKVATILALVLQSVLALQIKPSAYSGKLSLESMTRPAISLATPKAQPSTGSTGASSGSSAAAPAASSPAPSSGSAAGGQSGFAAMAVPAALSAGNAGAWSAASTSTVAGSSAGSSAAGAPAGSSAAASATAASASGASTSSATSASTATGSLTYDQFCQCVQGYSKTTAGGSPATPSQDVYNAYVKYGAANMSLDEQVQFLANAIWETAGLQTLTEECGSSCSAYAGYQGRGYLQLSYQANYAAASQAIFGNDTLTQNPDQVATVTVGWQTANWFWINKVRPGVSSSDFTSRNIGPAVKVINGGVECNGACANAPKNRLAIYNACLAATGLSGTGSLSGCCT